MFPDGDVPPTERALTTVAKSLESDQHANAMLQFYLPEMNIDKDAWAKARFDRHDEDEPFWIYIDNEWLPAKYRAAAAESDQAYDPSKSDLE